MRKLIFIFSLSLIVKLIAAQLLVWEVDYVPVIARGQLWLSGGAFPAVGTLSSVAAYNMPFLVWMHLPMMFFTPDVSLIFILTGCIFNFIAIYFVYKLGAEMFTPRVGLIGAILFTFSETGISSAYTAWAQLFLPGFFVMVAYCLYRWKMHGDSRYSALAIVLSTAAFMTHFSAILLFGIIIIFWLILRLPLRWKGIAIGVIVSVMMLAPYIAFESERDFVDLRAFFTRQPTISKAVLDEYAYLKPENQPANPQPATPEAPILEDDPIPTPQAQGNNNPQQASRLERGIGWLVSIPTQFIGGLRLVFNTDLNSLRLNYPIFYAINQLLRLLLEVSFWLGTVYALYQYARYFHIQSKTLSPEQRSLKSRLNLALELLISTEAGRYIILLLFVLGIIAGLIIVRASPTEQPSYYMGLFSLQLLMCAYGIQAFMESRNYHRQIWILIILFVGLGAFDRIVRVTTHDFSTQTNFNLGLYSSINAATAWIADDYSGDDNISVSYDIMPEMAHQWWIAPWNRVDDSYRIGMAYDYLLDVYHGLKNSNTNPTGLAENPDYIVTFASGLKRHELDDYEVEQFGAIYVLKESS